MNLDTTALSWFVGAFAAYYLVLLGVRPFRKRPQQTEGPAPLFVIVLRSKAVPMS